MPNAACSGRAGACQLLQIYGILVMESFKLTEESKKIILEQVDGAIELHGDVYLVEMKWLNQVQGGIYMLLHLESAAFTLESV